MNLMIELDDRLLTNLAETTVRNALKRVEFGNQLPMVEYIQEQVKSATMDYIKCVNWTPMIHEIATGFVETIVRDVTSQVLTKHVKRVVKEMKEKGELV
jgi:hypothetical protein